MATTSVAASNVDAKRWPFRLTVGLLGVPILFLLLLPALQASRSTGPKYHLHPDRIAALIFLMPGLVLLSALAISTLRYPQPSESAVRTANKLLVVSLFFATFVIANFLLAGW